MLGLAIADNASKDGSGAVEGDVNTKSTRRRRLGVRSLTRQLSVRQKRDLSLTAIDVGVGSSTARDEDRSQPPAPTLVGDARIDIWGNEAGAPGLIVTYL